MEINQLFNGFTELYRPYTKRVQPLLNRYHLHTVQFLVLKDIYLHETTTLVEISKRRSIEKPTTRKLLKALIDQDLLVITQGEDKRQKLLSLSDKGKQVYLEAMNEITTLQTEIIREAGLTEEAIEQTIQTLQQLKLSI